MEIYSQKYLIVTAIYSILFFTFGGIMGTLVENIFPEFDENKSEFRLYVEIVSQLFCIVIAYTVFRFTIMNILNKHLVNENVLQYDKYSSFLIAPILFTLQPSLQEKIKKVFDF